MRPSFVDQLRCPVTQEPLKLEIIERQKKNYEDGEADEIHSALIHSPSGLIYPIINGVPRMLVESFLDYEEFVSQHIPDYPSRKRAILRNYGPLVEKCRKKNLGTKKSFAFEWKLFKYNEDKTWHWDKPTRKLRFLNEVEETEATLGGKEILDAGCGNGVLTTAMAELGAHAIGMDLSNSIERAHRFNTNRNADFVQGDLQIPPLRHEQFDIVYATGVIHHTNNTELAFSCLHELVRRSGKYYVWIYHPVSDAMPKFYTWARKYTHRLPLRVQYWFYLIFLIPPSAIIKGLRGSGHNVREQMVDIFDGLSPEFRHEHTPDELASWFLKRNYYPPRISVVDYLGFGGYAIKK